MHMYVHDINAYYILRMERRRQRISFVFSRNCQLNHAIALWDGNGFSVGDVKHGENAFTRYTGDIETAVC